MRSYAGATCGRVAGRIGGAKFTIKGELRPDDSESDDNDEYESERDSENERDNENENGSGSGSEA